MANKACSKKFPREDIILEGFAKMVRDKIDRMREKTTTLYIIQLGGLTKQAAILSASFVR